MTDIGPPDWLMMHAAFNSLTAVLLSLRPCHCSMSTSTSLAHYSMLARGTRYSRGTQTGLGHRGRRARCRSAWAYRSRVLICRRRALWPRAQLIRHADTLASCRRAVDHLDILWWDLEEERAKTMGKPGRRLRLLHTSKRSGEDEDALLIDLHRFGLEIKRRERHQWLTAA